MAGRAAALLMLAALLRSAAADQHDPRLNDLFDRLKLASSAAAAVPIEAEVWRVWSEVADPDATVLYGRALSAMSDGDAATAAAALDLLLELAPGFAEGWNKRATLRYLMNDDPGSIADIRRTLALEPRHFGALSGLALIYERQGRPDEAVRSLEAALAIHPFLPGGAARLRALRETAAGDPT